MRWPKIVVRNEAVLIGAGPSTVDVLRFIMRAFGRGNIRFTTALLTTAAEVGLGRANRDLDAVALPRQRAASCVAALRASAARTGAVRPRPAALAPVIIERRVGNNEAVSHPPKAERHSQSPRRSYAHQPIL